MRGRLPAEYAGFYVALAAVAGLLFGSFLNVCIYRIPRDLSVVSPRSFCPQCGGQIAWYDNLPVFSYFVLHGRCRSCKNPIAFRYPIVELATALLFSLAVAEYGWTIVALKWCVFEVLLVALFWTDLEERILPDELTLGGAVAGLIFAIFVPVPSVMADLTVPAARAAVRSLLDASAGAIFLAGPLWALGALYNRLRKREGLGLGDVKLLVLIGIFLGLEHGLTALLIGAVGGTAIGLTYILVARKSASTYELPFGTFLCAGAAIVPLIGKFI
jgi:leader peptidase (prepilin peptidase) / N-methyltransferase